MASSNWEEASASSVAANAPPVTMEAKMLVATGHDHCQQLKDMLSKADPSSMLVVVMASGNQTSTPKPPSPVMDPRLLAAACSGSFQDLEALLSGEDLRASSVGSSAKQPASGDEESFLRESLLDMVTIGGDTALHMVATHGDSGDFLQKARIIHRMAKNLLFVQNNMGDTPLHCAARAGRSQMVSLFIDLANGQDNNNASRVKALLETENENKWTALHEAVHGGNIDIVKLLMMQDPELACFPKDAASPLYLAILLGNKIIAKTLYELSSGVLSYSGPDGQNALHAAVLRGKDLTKTLLGWNNTLTIQQDVKGSTPPHLASSALGQGDLLDINLRQRNLRDIYLLLLKANPNVLYQADNDGSFPIHVAASVGATLAISDFLKESPNCVGLRDARGRTFLHVAVEQGKMWTVRSVCSNQSVSWILNMLDNDGNTAMHLVVQGSSFIMFCALLGNSQVQLNLTNKKGETPFDIACSNLITRGLHSNRNSEAIIEGTLRFVGAKSGICRRDYLEEKNKIVQARQNETREMENVKDGTQSLCIGSVLIATVTFGASFAMPGGYRADDHANGGTPTLAGRFAFDAFMLANSFAFTSSMIATVALMSSGLPMHNPWSRQVHLRIAFCFMEFSITGLVAAFALGTYMMLAQVAYKTAIVVCVMSSLILLYQRLEFAIKNSFLVSPFFMRKGICHGIFWTFPLAVFAFVVSILGQLWPIAVIFGLTALSHTGGKVEPVAQPPTPLA